MKIETKEIYYNSEIILRIIFMSLLGFSVCNREQSFLDIML